ncbi:MAG: YiiX/YebB-like N1pC/P60 family cysteine hydrolase [Alistipes sp.]|nr:YiiX/YebB-like N1pC/P60 family cysteine hydrolase [Alistipes sp.]
MKKILIAIGILIVAIAIPLRSWLIEPLSAQDAPITDIREGDVIFHTSQSSQSPLIQIGTRSHITHCGIVVIKEGKPYVLETLKTLVLTPLDKFIVRGKDGKYWLKRSDKEDIKIDYAHYLGKSYDFAFSFDNDIYYCSELVYDIYKRQLGIELCTPKQIGDYLILGTDKLDKIEEAMSRRGITKEQYAVAPVDIFESEHLYNVR